MSEELICNICDKKFKQRFALQKHLAINHFEKIKQLRGGFY